MFFFNAFAFLEVEPQIKCMFTPGVWTYSDQDDDLVSDYCGVYSDVCEINYESKATINNLIVQLDFVCAPGWKLGLVGALFLIGIVVGCSFITKMGDSYGRRLIYALGLFVNGAIVVVVVFSKSVILTYFCLFMLGISITARYYVGYTYNLEYQLKRNQVVVSTIQFMAESVVYLLDIAYFVYISDNWVYL